MRLPWLLLGLALLGVALPLGADEPKKADAKPTTGEAKPLQIPYRLTETKHVLIRAKINGKGPFNFILDTGAPALFVATSVCKKLGVAPGKDGWGTFEKFEVEGGAVLSKAKGRIEDPFQLEGMNSLGLAGAELHGMIGYTVLARFRIEFDFTKDKMTWTPLDYNPPLPRGLDGGGTAGMDAMAGMVKMVTGLLGKRPKPEIVPRGFLGFAWEEKENPKTEAAEIVVNSVVADGPAAKAGLKVGDVIREFQAKHVKVANDIQKLANSVRAGDTVKVTILHPETGPKAEALTIQAAEGF
jgi:hypothetical protein